MNSRQIEQIAVNAVKDFFYKARFSIRVFQIMIENLFGMVLFIYKIKIKQQYV